MDEARKSLYQQLLGPAATTKGQSVANLIGGMLFAGGLSASYDAMKGMKDYAKATKGIQSAVGAIPLEAGSRQEKAQAALNADLAGYQAGAESVSTRGLETRGITDQRVAQETRANIGQGLSGAYASARAALSGAKLRAQQGLSTAMVNYNIDLAQKQYQSMMDRYQGQMGIWGALGGLGGAILSTPTPEKKQKAPSPPMIADALPSKEVA